MNTPHTFTLPVAIRNLMSDMAGDEKSGSLPQNFAMRASLLALRADVPGLVKLHDELAMAGWSCFVSGDMTEAGRYRNACAYCTALNNRII